MSRIPVVAGAPQSVSATSDDRKRIVAHGSVSYTNPEGSGSLAAGEDVVVQDNTTVSVASGRAYVTVLDVAGVIDSAGNRNTGVFRDRQVFNVLDYVPAIVDIGELIAEGSTTSCTAYVRLAVAAAEVAGGGIVDFPRPGHYFFSSSDTQTDNGVTWSVAITGDNITLRFADGAKCSWSGSQELFFFSGYGKPGGMTSWGDYYLGDAATATYRAISAVAAGDTSITCTTASHAGAISKGDYIYLRTGQRVAARTTEPKAELVKAAADGNAGTGVVELEWPVVHDYAQEYYISGTTGLTSTSVTANAATFGAAEVTARIQQNVGIVNFQPYGTGTGKPLRFMGVDGWKVHGVRGKGGNSLMDAIEHHGAHWRDIDYLLDTSVAASSDRFLITTATGVTGAFFDGEIKGRAIGESALIIHFHEEGQCVGRGLLKIDTCAGGDGANLTPVSIRAGAIVDFDGVLDVVSQGSASPIYIAPECTSGGKLCGIVRAQCTDATKGVSSNAAGWEIEADPEVVLIEQGDAKNSGKPRKVYTYAVVLDKDNQTATLGTLPANAMVLDAGIHTIAEGNSDGSDRITVGYDTAENVFVISAADIDVGTGGTGRESLDVSEWGTSMRLQSGTKRTVKAYYVNSGSEPSTGQWLVWIMWSRMPNRT